jgi:hypothetical protein
VSKICVLSKFEAETYRKDRNLLNCQNHEHVSRIVADGRVANDEAAWLGDSCAAITMVKIADGIVPWRWASRRSGGGAFVLQLVR